MRMLILAIKCDAKNKDIHWRITNNFHCLSLSSVLSIFASAEEKLSAAKNGKPITKEEFVDYGKKVVQPIFEDFKRLFLDINGDFRALSATYSSARVLDPNFAMGKNIDLLADKIKALQSFGFDEFCDASGIISAMIDELPAYYSFQFNRFLAVIS